MEIKMMVQSTPNPNALKFVLNIPVKTDGKATYKSAQDCAHNPLARALFTVANVSEVYFFDNYITITQDGSAEWDQIEEELKSIIMSNAESHDPNFMVDEPKRTTAVAETPELAKINEILDRTIRPALQMDGGDLVVVGFDGQTVTVNYQGACGSCPSSTAGTLRAVENILKDEFNPEVVVEAV